MIAKLSTQTLESLHRLNSGNRDWEVVLASIKVDRDTLVTKLIGCDDEHERSVYQGMLRWIDKFLFQSKNVSDTLHKRKENR